MTIAERLRRKIQRLDLEFEGKPLQVTVSGGVATFPVDTDVQGDLMDCADRALYRAKTLGRNRICLFSPDKRHFYRMDMLGPVKVQELGMKVNQKPALARIKDLSLSGMLFEVQEPLSLSSRIQMEVPLSSRETPLVLVGQVTRVQPHGANYNIGATFLHFGEQDRAALNQHFSSTLRTQIPMA
ncbi:MAG: diguanylate cyclase [Nitrospinaceae bacterium]|nr:diguanylate cyclase [Nitrospinaceae bacterium]NIR53905.1 diguanylate cyclase [Nitrospinaceae bacterium]NIS84319.1 diguanylate cyclase [Nitrospinaceae bacterium]NIT81126.1 diguanylate cyclase [Nitrospinaceae bacterium]NIU43408.1 diguanylate cyclase [Nitrospinaceae bacterium]